MLYFTLTVTQRYTALFILLLLLLGFGINFVASTIRKIKWRRKTKKRIEDWAKEHGFGSPGSSKK